MKILFLTIVSRPNQNTAPDLLVAKGGHENNDITQTVPTVQVTKKDDLTILSSSEESTTHPGVTTNSIFFKMPSTVQKAWLMREKVN